MSIDTGILATLFEVPLWVLLATGVVGAVAGIVFLLLSILLFGGRKQRVVRQVVQNKVATELDVREQTASQIPVPDLASEAASPGIRPERTRPERTGPPTVAPAPESVLVPEPKPIPAKAVSRPVLPVRQTYWYYVSGVPGKRFSTLRDALSALWGSIPEGKRVAWGDLNADTRAKIKRVKVTDKQPDMEDTAPQPVQRRERTVPVERPAPIVPPMQTTVRTRRPTGSDGSRVKRLGNGAFVTIPKKE